MHSLSIASRSAPASEFRTDNRHPCKSKSRKKHKIAGRAGESAHFDWSGDSPAHVCLTAGGPCIPQDRTSICCLELQRAVADDRVCVLCQSRNNPKGASEVAFVAQPVNCRTWQPAHRIIPFLFFLIRKVFYATALPAISSAGTKSCFLRSTASM